MDCSRTVDALTRGRCGSCIRTARARYNASAPDRTGSATPARRAHQKFMNSTQWRKMSKDVRLRDGACVDCGSTEKLTVHHLVPVRVNPELALDPDNCVTLCRFCHGARERRAA